MVSFLNPVRERTRKPNFSDADLENDERAISRYDDARHSEYMKQLLKKAADNGAPRSLANYLRRRRAALLVKYVERHFPMKSSRQPLDILDVGGTESFWKHSGLAQLPDVRVTLLNLTQDKTSLPNFTSVAGDAREMPQFGDHSFDLAFSNSVIEHVGDFDDKRRMADEIQRVGRHFFVQTPAKYFPIEPHFLFPFFTYLPERFRAELVCRCNLGWYPAQGSLAQARDFLRGFQLLTRRDIIALFPESTILRESLCGLTKSYIACGASRAGIIA